MKSRLVPFGTLIVAVLVAACSSGSAETPAIDETTANLLAGPVGDGMSTPIAADPSLVPEGPRINVTDLGVNAGDSLAIVKVVELSDFGCTYCRQFHLESYPVLLEEFMDTGMVEWKLIPFVTGMFGNSLPVTEASECVLEQDLDAYTTFTDRLWTDQREWKDSDDAEALAREWATEVGIDMDGYDSCISEDRQIPRVASSTSLARQLGVRGTPTFVIIGYPPLQGALPLDVFQQLFTTIHADETRARAEAAAALDSAAAADSTGSGS